MIRWLLLLLSLLFSNLISAQKYPQGYFGSPLEIPLYLSANFGAIRGNHFHSGIDFKTEGKEGQKVCVAADGYVVRIKVSPFGYGKALYINHPNGYTTVYAHLQSFSPELDSFVKEAQYRKKTFDIELFPPAGKFSFKKGDQIGLSGNSGGSTGPHLHFEIRDTKTEEIINPMLFGLDIQDKYPPRFSNTFVIYEVNDDYKHRNGNYPFVEVNRGTLKRTWNDTLKVTPGTYAFGVWADDYVNESNSDVGINYLQLSAEGKQVFSCAIERFAFDETRMVNCHMDYGIYSSQRRKWHKCFADDGNGLGFYTPHKRVFINVAQGEAKPIVITASDLGGHADSFSFMLVGDDSQPHFKQPAANKKITEFAYPGTTYNYSGDTYKITIPKWALYDTAAATTKHSSSGKRKDLYSGYISVLDADVPLHKSFTISIKPDVPAGIDTKKLVVVRLTGRGLRYPVSEGGEYKNGWITATSRSFGVFSVMQDNAPPVISRFRQKGDIIAVHINDYLSGIDTYNAYINGEWWLMEYDAKDDLLWGTLPADLAAGKHELKIVVSDKTNNTNTLTQTIYK